MTSQAFLASSPFNLPAAQYAYTAAQASDILDPNGPARFGFPASAPLGLACAIFTCDQAITSGSVTAFALNDPSTWPPNCTFLGILKTASALPATVPPLPSGVRVLRTGGIGPFVVAMRLDALGGGAHPLIASGQTSEVQQLNLGGEDVPEAQYEYTGAIDVTSLDPNGPARFAFMAPPIDGITVAVYSADDSSIEGDVAALPWVLNDPTTFPAGCTLLGVVTSIADGSGSSSTDLLVTGGIGPFVVYQRLDALDAGATVDITVSGASTGTTTASVTPVANTPVKRDASGGDFNAYEKLGPTGGHYPTTGLLRMSQLGEGETALVTQRNQANNATNTLIATTDTDGVVFGDAANSGSTTVRTGAGGGGNLFITAGGGSDVRISGADVRTTTAATEDVNNMLVAPDTTVDGNFLGQLAAIDSVDSSNVMEFVQTTGAGARTAILRNPTITGKTRTMELINTGSASLTLYGVLITAIGVTPGTASARFRWSPTAAKWAGVK